VGGVLVRGTEFGGGALHAQDGVMRAAGQGVHDLGGVESGARVSTRSRPPFGWSSPGSSGVYDVSVNLTTRLRTAREAQREQGMG
jgi:hypothetical protein